MSERWDSTPRSPELSWIANQQTAASRRNARNRGTGQRREPERIRSEMQAAHDAYQRSPAGIAFRRSQEQAHERFAQEQHDAKDAGIFARVARVAMDKTPGSRFEDLDVLAREARIQFFVHPDQVDDLLLPEERLRIPEAHEFLAKLDVLGDAGVIKDWPQEGCKQ